MTSPAGLGLAVADIATLILDTVGTHFAAASGVDLPARRVIAPGNPRLIAWDNCEQVVVTMSGIGVGSAPGENSGVRGSGNPVSSMGMRHAVYAVQITRRVPESHDGTTPPPDAELTKAGLAVMRDAGLLSQAMVAVVTAVSEAVPRGSRVIPGAVEMLGPEGGYVAVESSLTVTAGLLV